MLIRSLHHSVKKEQTSMMTCVLSDIVQLFQYGTVCISRMFAELSKYRQVISFGDS